MQVFLHLALKSSENKEVQKAIQSQIKKSNNGNSLTVFTQEGPLRERMAAILAADILIFAVSDPNFSSGFEVSFSVQYDKPILFLYGEKLKSTANDLKSLSLPHLEIRSFGKTEEIKNVIFDFLLKTEGKTKARFNLLMDKTQDNYLEWAAFTYNQSKTELIRDSIREYMKDDQRYQKYLEGEN